MHKKKMNRALFTDVMLSVPALIGYTVLFIIPVFIGIYYSMTNWNGISKTYSFTGIANYVKLIGDIRFLRTIGFTMKYTVILTAGTLLMSLLTALVLNSKPRGEKFFKTFFFFPCLFSMITTGLLFREIFSMAIPKIGSAIGSEVFSKSMLSNPNLAIYAIEFVNIWGAMAIPTVLLLAALKNVPRDLYEVVNLDGGNAWHAFKAVTMPFILPTISMIFIISLKSGLSVYEIITVLTAGGPGRSTESIAYIIYTKGFSENQYAYAAAMSVVMFIFMSVISLIYIKATKGKEVNV